ncbi:hypothetical protein ACFLX0_01620 [Chloroflexota bacterium]
MNKLVDKPHNIVSTVVGLNNPDITKIVGFPATKRELLDMLQVRLMAFEDRVEVNAVFYVDSIKRLLCTSS